MKQIPLQGAVFKLNRAEEHLQTILHAVQEFGESDFYETVGEMDRQGRFVARLRNVKHPPPEMSILIGECVFNFRSALDQIAYALAAAHTKPLPRSWARSSAFPIFNNGPQYRGRGGAPATRKLRGMSRGARATIQRLQPFHRRKTPELAYLWVLEELSSIDKHRLIHLTAAVGVQSSFRIGGAGFMRMTKLEPLPVEIKDNAIAARFYGTFDIEAGVDVKAEIRPDVVFDRRSEATSVRGRSVARTLIMVRDVIGLIVLPALGPEFERLFPELSFSAHVEDTGETIQVL